MRRIYVCSPLRAPTTEGVQANIERAKQLCLYAMLINNDVSAFAPHVFFPSFLDDGNPPERELGMRAGNAWLEVSDELWIFSKRSVSIGMAKEIEEAARLGLVILWDPSCWSGLGED